MPPLTTTDRFQQINQKSFPTFMALSDLGLGQAGDSHGSKHLSILNFVILASPLQMAQDKKTKWIKTTVSLYGKQGQALVPDHRCLVVSQRRSATPAHLSWSVIPAAAAATIASSRSISLSAPHKS